MGILSISKLWEKVENIKKKKKSEIHRPGKKSMEAIARGKPPSHTN